ncbi:MAG TPA: hypothetical protein VMT33_07660 [Candidatus Bathyarchaeia archaeon]|nr:hypothetical protein [Candidatus Bathyarchaeia archaeon]
MPRARAVHVLLILAAVGVAALSFRAPGVDRAIFRDWADDAFFYVVVADNVVEGRGSTSDGIGRTNGYHPAWMAVHVAVRSLFDDPLRPLAAIQFALLAAVMLLLYRMLSERLGPTPALIAALIASFETSYRRVLGAGMETELAFAALLLLLVLLRGVRLHEIERKRRLAIQGALALLFFARLDGALFWIGLAGILAVERARLSSILRLFAPPAALAAIYLAFNALYFGSAMPISGRIKALGLADIAAKGMDYVRNVFDRLVLLYGLRTSQELEFSIHFPRRDGFHLAEWALYLVVAGVTIAYLTRRWSKRGELDLAMKTLLAGVALHTIYYAFLQWDDYALSWARGPELLLLTVAAATIVAPLLRPRPIGYIAVFLTLVLLVRTQRESVHRAGVVRDFNTSGKAFLEGVAFLREHAAPDEIIASESLGFVGHYADRRIVSLDGLLNSVDYYRRYLRPGRIGDYLREHRVRYIAQGIRKDADPIAYMSGVLGVAPADLSIAASFDGPATIPRRYVVWDLHRGAHVAAP